MPNRQNSDASIVFDLEQENIASDIVLIAGDLDFVDAPLYQLASGIGAVINQAAFGITHFSLTVISRIADADGILYLDQPVKHIVAILCAASEPVGDARIEC